MNQEAPVIILGAPRSGTSLLQHIVRNCPGFVSPPRESQHIWEEYVHPSLNEWAYEGVSSERLGSIDVESLRATLQDQAITSGVWKLLRGSGIYDSPHLMAVARRMGGPLISVLTSLSRLLSRTQNEPRNRRFVDKSVHGALWLQLVLRVFPDCRIIHITRDPLTAVPSIMESWSDTGRFKSFDVPSEGGQREWCFGLVPGWQDLLAQPLDIRCAHQWIVINERILEHADSMRAENRYLQLHLESLVGPSEETITELREFLNCAHSDYWQSLISAVPRINARSGTERRTEVLSDEAVRLLAPMRRRLGYQ